MDKDSIEKTLYEALYGDSNPNNFKIPKSLAPKQLTILGDVGEKIKEGYQLYLSLFYNNNKEMKYRIHGLWLDKYVKYNNHLELDEQNTSSFSKNDIFTIEDVNPLIVKTANRVWYAGKGYPPNIKFWQHEWYKHGVEIKNKLYNNITLPQFMVSVIDLYMQATTKDSNGKCLADNFVGNTKIGDDFLIPVSNNLEFLYNSLSENYIKQIEEIKTRPIYN